MAGNKFLNKQNELAAYQDAQIYGVIICSACEGHGTLTGRRYRHVSTKVSDRPYK